MGFTDWAIVIIVSIWAIAAIAFIVRSKKKGGCSCGGSSSCQDCAACARNKQCDHAKNKITEKIR